MIHMINRVSAFCENHCIYHFLIYCSFHFEMMQISHNRMIKLLRYIIFDFFHNRNSTCTYCTHKNLMTTIIMFSSGHTEMWTNPTSMRNMIVWIQMETSPLLFRYQRCLFSVHDDKYIRYSGLSEFIQFYSEIFSQVMNPTENFAMPVN